MLKRKKGYFNFRITPDEPTTETKGKIEVKIPDEGYVENLQIIFYQFDKIVQTTNIPYRGKEKNEEREYSIYSAEFTLKKSGIYWFYFTLLIEGQRYYVYQNEENLQTNEKNNEYPNECCWKLQVKSSILKEYPEWTGRIIYHFMPDRFAIGSNGIIPVEGRKTIDWKDRKPRWEPDDDGVYRNEDFYGGNFEGAQEKVSYLKKLEFDTVYMGPIYKSKTYHHYDPEDYYGIDPMLGTWDDHEKMIKVFHENGIWLIEDMVFNHSSDRHPYFQSAISDVNSPYRDYYKFNDKGEPITWYGFKDMPEQNNLNTNVQEEKKKVLKKYLDAGVDAVRFDLGEILPREFLESMATLKKQYPHLIFINEMWGLATNKWNPQIFDGQANSVTNYAMTDAIMRWVRTGNYEHFNDRFEKVYGEYPKEVQDILLNVISSHDIPSAMTMLVGEGMNEEPETGEIWDIEGPWRHEGWFDTYGFRKIQAYRDMLSDEDRQRGEKLLKIAITMGYFIPGNPCTFMGTENAESGYKDKFSRKPMNWERPNIPMHEFIRAIGKFRHEQKAILAQGEVRNRKSTNNILLLERYVGRSSLILAVNRTGVQIEIPDFNGYEVIFTENSTKDKLGEYGILILKRE